MEKARDERGKTVWRIVGSLIAVVVLCGAILIFNSCGGGGGGNDGLKTDNSSDQDKLNDDNPPADDNNNPPVDDKKDDPPPDDSNNNNPPVDDKKDDPPPDDKKDDPPTDVKTVNLLPKTGQTTCYNNLGQVIDCNGTGQDGESQAGVPLPTPRFTDNNDGTVTDNLTGLIWKKDANEKNHAIGSWMTASSSSGGGGEWRLPTVYELESLLDAQEKSPALPKNHPFQNVKLGLYWTSTTSGQGAVAIDLTNGMITLTGRSTGFYGYYWPVKKVKAKGAINVPKTGQKICYGEYNEYDIYNSSLFGKSVPCPRNSQDGGVQAGEIWPTPRFTDNNDGTVTDNLTGLMWTKNAYPSKNSWDNGLKYIKDMNSGAISNFGYTDWRMPNKREMLYMIDWDSEYLQIVKKDAPFTNQTNSYWTATNVQNGYDAWFVKLYVGTQIIPLSKWENATIWPVRTVVK